MEKIFEEQIKSSIPLSLERINNLTNKTFSSGKPIKENDIILFAYKHIKLDGEVKVELIRISEDEIHEYEYDENTINNVIPTIK
jgi:hypothetical protein